MMCVSFVGVVVSVVDGCGVADVIGVDVGVTVVVVVCIHDCICDVSVDAVPLLLYA